jgi:outer membrane lipoprotein-sorting protein
LFKLRPYARPVPSFTEEAVLNFLRSISTRRLLSICALALVIVVGGTAVALATSGGGPKPPAKPLADAVHEALEAPTVPGISADVHFTNNLIDASSLEGKDPLLAGATGRVWASPSGGGKLRLELQAEEAGNDSQVLIEGHHFEIYDGTSETVYEGTLPEEKGEGEGEEAVPSTAKIQGQIEKAEKHVDLSGAIPSDVGGKATYTVQAAPSHDGGLLGRVELAWDAATGIPLRGAVYSSESSSPVLELDASNVSFEAVSESVFEISPPASAKVVDLSPQDLEGPNGHPNEVTGEGAVAAAVDFPLAAPASLAGLPQSEVRAIEVEGETAALVTYGKGLGGIAVIESKSSPEGEGGGPIGGEGELGLPKVAIGNVKGEELDTALGSVLHFSRGGVDYTVLGSVPPAAVEAAARDL